MRTLIIVEPGPVGPPPEMLPMVLGAFKDWRDRWRPKMEMFEFFAGRGGGWGVFNTANETELAQAMAEFPFAPFSSIQVHPTMNGDEGLAMTIATTNQMLAMMQPK